MRIDGEGSRRRFRALAAGSLAVSGIGGVLVLMLSDRPAPPATALEPIQPAQTAPPATSEPGPGSREFDTQVFGSLGGSDVAASGTDAGTLLRRPAAPPPSPASPPALPALPALQLPPPQVPPAIDWGALVQPYLQSQANAAAANIAGSITSAVGSGAADAAAAALGDLILYAAYSENGKELLAQLEGTELLAQLQKAPAAAAALPPPDFSGLSAAFAAAAGQPPYGVPTPLQLPELPPLPELPDLSVLSQLPQLPPPGEMPDLPTAEQVAAALAAVPALALALPALPALPPIGAPDIGLPGLPAPSPMGLPPIGLPAVGFPSITRLFGLPF